MKTIVTLLILCMSITSFSQITNGLVGHWTLDDTANDFSGNGYHGTPINVVATPDRNATANAAYEFNDGSYIQLGDPAQFDFGSSTFTVSAWVNRTTSTVSWKAPIIGKWYSGSSPGANEWLLMATSNGVDDKPSFSIEIGTQDYKVESFQELNLNQWYLITAVRKTTAIELYIDGALVGTTTVPNQPINNVAGRNLEIGRFFNGIHLNGAKIDDLKIFNRDLSASEITQLYSSSNQVSTTNTFLGFSAGQNNTTGENNTFIGAESGENNTTGKYNTFLGQKTGLANTTGEGNVFLGSSAGFSNTTGKQNVFIGHYSGLSNTTGEMNLFSGLYTGRYNTTGSYNSFSGARAGELNTTGAGNAFFGYKSGFSNTTGNDNVFTGSFSGASNTSGIRNIFLGASAGYSNTVGKENVFSGFYAGRKNTSGEYNVFLGSYSGSENIDGDRNVFLGHDSGKANLSGAQNVFIGDRAGTQNATGIENVFIGSASGDLNTAGSFNTFSGHKSGVNNNTGNRNTFYGYKSGESNVDGSGNVFLGNESGYNETGSNKLYVDNSNTATPLLYGDFSSDQLGVNTNVIPAGYAFAVKGKMIAEELKVQVYPWADFVFKDDYKLPTLAEVAQYIKEKGHLQHIPSAKEVAKNGISLGQMDAKLLRKIEELTLYTIQQNNKLLEQQKELQKQENVNALLKARLDKIEAFLKAK